MGAGFVADEGMCEDVSVAFTGVVLRRPCFRVSKGNPQLYRVVCTAADVSCLALRGLHVSTRASGYALS